MKIFKDITAIKVAISTLFVIFFFFSAQGQQVWNFSLKDVQNNQHSFNDLKGEDLTLIDFWTTWCKPCKKSIPELNKIYESYQDQGVQVIGINCDGPRSVAKVAPFSQAMHIKYPVLIDINAELMNGLNLASYPTLIMVNGDGQIEYVHEGFVSGDEKIIREEINKRLSN